MKQKDKKTKESTIGKIIYGFLLFMPLIAIFIKCGYTMFNKNAYQSYYGQTINQTQFIDVSSNNNIDNQKTYYFYGANALSTEYSGTIYYTNAEYITGLNNITNEQIEFINNSTRLYYYRGTSITFYDDENNSLAFGGTGIIKINGLLSNPTSTNTFRMIKEVQYNKFSYVDNVFYYSVNQVSENPLFNWTQNTFIYTGVQTFTNALNINNVFFPLLLSYWMILSVVYIIYDLGLMIIQIVHRKIHELGDSI